MYAIVDIAGKQFKVEKTNTSTLLKWRVKLAVQ